MVKRENRTDLAFAATDGTAFFDRECKRLFVLTPERGLEILDPNSSTPTRVLLTIPVNGMREETIADQSRRHLLTFALSPSGDQIAIGINHNLTFLDVSGGRPSPTDDSTSTLPGPM